VDSRNNQYGFAGSVVLLLVILVAAVSLAAYGVFIRDDSSPDIGDTTTVQVKTPSTNTEELSDTTDIDSALSDLDAIDIDQQLDTDSLDSDIQDL